MALTVTKVDTLHNFGDVSATFWDVTLDASYPSQGYPVTGNMFAVSNNLIAVVPTGHAYQPNQAQPGTAFIVNYDKTTKTLRVFGMAVAAGAATPLLEVTLATNLALYQVRLMILGY
jgi:hypothetical protein